MVVYILENLLLCLSLVGIVILLYFMIGRAVDLFLGEDPAFTAQTQKIETVEQDPQTAKAQPSETHGAAAQKTARNAADKVKKDRRKKYHVGHAGRHQYTGLHFVIPKQSAGHSKRS